MLKTSFFTLSILYCSMAMSYDSIELLLSDIKKNKTSCTQLITHYIQRIKRYDLDTTRGAPLNAIININSHAITKARILDKAYKDNKHLVGPLHCVPIVVKDNFDTYDMPSSSGSLALLGSQPIKDAELVARLRQAGAIILAKTAMDEFASGVIGISSRSGRIGNAFAPTQNPGGSSGGSAVAIASGFALVSLGTDNSGSVRIPAIFNGLYGLRPSSNLLPNTGVFPRGNLDGVPGPITKNLNDMETILRVLTGKKTLHTPNIAKKITLGLVTSFNQQTIDYKNYERFLGQIRSLGITIKPISINSFNSDRKDNAAGEVMQINDYLALFASTRKNFTDICHSKRTRSFGTLKACLDYAKTNPSPASKTYRNVKAMLVKNRSMVEGKMNKYKLNALIMPISTKGIATYDIDTINTWRYPLSSNSGLPSLAFPIKYNDKGMPMGIELIGKFNQENTLIAIVQKWSLAFATPHFPTLKKSNHDLNKLNCAQFNNIKTLIGWKTYYHFLIDHDAYKLKAKHFKNLVDKWMQALP
jgi:amidase